jgi:hypothetical protein
VLRHNSEHLHGECWSLSNQEAAKRLVIKEMFIYQCYMPAGESFGGDLVSSGVVCVPRVLRHNSEHLHGECCHSAIRKQQSLPGSSKECDTSVLHLLVSHLCDLVSSG